MKIDLNPSLLLVSKIFKKRKKKDKSIKRREIKIQGTMDLKHRQQKKALIFTIFWWTSEMITAQSV